MCAVKPPCFSHIPIIPSAQVGPSFSECGMMYWKTSTTPKRISSQLTIKCSQTSRSKLSSVQEEKPPNYTQNLCSSVNHYPVVHKKSTVAPRKPWQVTRISTECSIGQNHGFSPGFAGPDFWMSLHGEYLPCLGQKNHPRIYGFSTLFYDREPFDKEWGKENATTDMNDRVYRDNFGLSAPFGVDDWHFALGLSLPH